MPRTPRVGARPLDAHQFTAGGQSAPATPRTRVPKPRLETLPSGLRLAGPNDESTVRGAVDLGYLRKLITTIGRKYPDDSTVKFGEERGAYTEVSPA